MMVPDYALISEIRLYSFGFENARANAQKLVRVLQVRRPTVSPPHSLLLVTSPPSYSHPPSTEPP